MRDFLQMTDPMPLKLGAKVEKPKEQTAEQEEQELRELARVVFEALPHNLAGQPMVGTLFQRKPVEPEKPKADADGWIEWNGGYWPGIPGCWVEVALRGGQRGCTRSEGCLWIHGGGDSDIVAYRVIG